MALIIVADDLTGACDAGTLFAGKAPVPVTVWPDPPVAAEVAVVDTEPRRLDRAAATDPVSDAAAQQAGATSWFKKIDSTLRRHGGAEIAALLHATPRPRAAPRRFRRPGPAPGRASRPPRGVRDAARWTLADRRREPPSRDAAPDRRGGARGPPRAGDGRRRARGRGRRRRDARPGGRELARD